MSGDGQGQVFPRKGGIEAYSPFWSGLAVEYTVVRVDHSVSVLVYVSTRYRRAVLVIDLLIEVERIGRVTHHVSLHVIADTTADASCLDSCIGRIVIGCQLGDTVVIVREVGPDGPVPVLSLKGDTAYLKLDTFVNQATDIGYQVVGQIGSRRDRNLVKQIRCFPIVKIQGTVESAVKESVINTHVVSGGGLPFQIGIVTVGLDGDDHLTVEHIHTSVGVVHIGGESRVVSRIEVLLSCLAPAQTEL